MIKWVKKILAMPFIAEKLSYLVFGALTTAVSLVVFWIANSVFDMDYRLATLVSWVIAVAFAFITNKLFVFRSKSFASGVLVKELLSFVTARLLSLLFDFSWMIFAVEILQLNEFLAKVLSNLVVIVLNYFFSKMFVFKNTAERPLPPYDGGKEES